jgi:hypothetical protein
VTGGGEISVPGGFANFGFVAQNDAHGPSGQLEYQNHVINVNVHSVMITSVNVIDAMHATFSGTCTKNGAPCTSGFTVTVEDNGEPGSGVDKFTITIDGGPPEGGSGPITKGNIQIHQTTAQNLGDRSTDCDTALAGCSSTTGRLAQLWNYVRSAFWLTPRVT